MALNLVLIAGGYIWIERKGGIKYLEGVARRRLAGSDTPTLPNIHINKVDIFSRNPVRCDQIVLLGDSILEYLPVNEFFKIANVLNRGIPGDTTSQVLDRLRPIVDGKPRAIVLLAGINDLQTGGNAADAKTNIGNMLDIIEESSPTTTVLLLPLLPVNERKYLVRQAPEYFGAPDANMPRRQDVEEINTYLKSEAGARDRVIFVDLGQLIDNTGQLAEKFTIDGLHLNGAGLQILASRVEEKFPPETESCSTF